MIRKYKDTHKTIDNILYKECRDCKMWLILDLKYFNCNKKEKDGFNVRCKSCQKIYNQNKYAENREKMLDNAKRTQKNNWKHYKKMQAKWVNENRDYANKRLQEWESQNPYRKTYKKNYRENNKDKFRRYSKNHNEKNHKISKKEWIACKEYFKDEDGDYCCAYCGLKIQNHFRIYKGELQNIDLHKEHVIYNGRNDIKNCIPSCNNCNNKKKLRTLNGWYNKNNPVYTIERYNKICKWIRYDCIKFSEPKDIKIRNKINKINFKK